jgi:hypothetical protein
MITQKERTVKLFFKKGKNRLFSCENGHTKALSKGGIKKIL